MMNLSKKMLITTLVLMFINAIFLGAIFWVISNNTIGVQSPKQIGDLEMVVSAFIVTTSVFSFVSLGIYVYAAKKDSIINSKMITFVAITFFALIVSLATGALGADINNNPMSHILSSVSDTRALLVLPTISFLAFIPASVFAGLSMSDH